MADDERPRFNLRLTPELEAAVNQASRRNGRSKNAEILDALEWRFRPHVALTVAEAMKPLLEQLDEDELDGLVRAIGAMTQKKGRRRS